MLTDIEACSVALLKLGEMPIQSFNDGTTESEVAAGLYGPTRDALLSAHPWSFATAQAPLAQLDATPVADYTYAYQLPSDFLRAVSVGAATGVGRGADYRIYEKRIHTHAHPVVLSYIFRPAEGAGIPAFFDAVLTLKLAAAFCPPLTESNSRTLALLKESEGELSRARLIDSQQQSPVTFEDYSLINVRG